MSNKSEGISAAVEALSARLIALEFLALAIAETSSNTEAIRRAFETYAAGIEAKMNAMPVSDRHLELLRDSLAAMRAALTQER